LSTNISLHQLEKVCSDVGETGIGITCESRKSKAWPEVLQ